MRKKSKKAQNPSAEGLPPHHNIDKNVVPPCLVPSESHCRQILPSDEAIQSLRPLALEVLRTRANARRTTPAHGGGAAAAAAAATAAGTDTAVVAQVGAGSLNVLKWVVLKPEGAGANRSAVDQVREQWCMLLKLRAEQLPRRAILPPPATNARPVAGRAGPPPRRTVPSEGKSEAPPQGGDSR